MKTPYTDQKPTRILVIALLDGRSSLYLKREGDNLLWHDDINHAELYESLEQLEPDLLAVRTEYPAARPKVV